MTSPLSNSSSSTVSTISSLSFFASASILISSAETSSSELSFDSSGLSCVSMLASSDDSSPVLLSSIASFDSILLSTASVLNSDEIRGSDCKEVMIPSSELSASPSKLSTSSNSSSMIVITSPSFSSALVSSEVSLPFVSLASSVDFSMESPSSDCSSST